MTHQPALTWKESRTIKQKSTPTRAARQLVPVLVAFHRDSGGVQVSMPGGRDPLKGMEWGKAFTQQIRLTPHYIDYLVKLQESGGDR